MLKPRIFFVVGHEEWGKSETLRALTDGNCHKKRITISGTVFFVRHMSNDDQPESYINLMKSIDPLNKPFIIAALCPDFERKNAKTESILSILRSKGYELFFWVIEYKFGKSEIVSPKEIQCLRKIGKVEVFSNKDEAAVRSKSFKQFILDNVPV